MPKPIRKRSCQQCGTKLKLAPSGRRKRFCSDACRQAAFRNEMTSNKAPSYPRKGYENCAPELIETQNDFLSRNEELELSHLRPIRRKSPSSRSKTGLPTSSLTECKSTMVHHDVSPSALPKKRFPSPLRYSRRVEEGAGTGSSRSPSRRFPWVYGSRLTKPACEGGP